MSSTTGANQDINAELGVTGTTSMNLNATAVRNLACRSSGAISFTDCRWGINFPARDVDDQDGFDTSTIPYSTTNTLDMFASAITNGSCDAEAKIDIFSDGSFQYQTDTSTGGSNTHIYKTWMTVTGDAVGNYTARFDIITGALSTGSSASGTDLALSTNRTFKVAAVNTGGQAGQSASVTGNLIIKRSGVTLLTRPVSLYAEAIDSDVGP